MGSRRDRTALCGSPQKERAPGSGGALWFTEIDWGIGRITTAGVITKYGPTGYYPNGIAVGPDGALWFTETDRIGRITTAGVITEYTAGLTPEAVPSGIAAGPDGALW